MSEKVKAVWMHRSGGECYLYDVTETDTEYVCRCVHALSLVTLFVGKGNTPEEASTSALRDAARIASSPSKATEDIEP